MRTVEKSAAICGLFSYQVALWEGCRHGSGEGEIPGHRPNVSDVLNSFDLCNILMELLSRILLGLFMGITSH